MEKLKSGDYILEGIDWDDHDNPRWDRCSHFEIGDKVTLHNYKGTADDLEDREYTTREFTVMANYTEEIEPVMSYSSKGSRKAEFEGTRNMVILVGGALSLVIGLIGVLNFVNSMLTSILTRRREFAMLQSVGMTTSQLCRMLMTKGMWFFTYQFTLMPLLLTIPVLLIIGMLLPAAVLGTVKKQSVVERLREAE